MKILLLLLMLYSPFAGFSDRQIVQMFAPEEPAQITTEEGEILLFDPLEPGELYLQNVIRVFTENPAIARYVLGYSLYHGAQIRYDLSKEVQKGVIPLFLQWDPRWGYQTYGSGYLAMTGCGPTCLSMVYCGLTGDTYWDPYRVACMSMDRGYYVWGVGTGWDLMEAGARSLGLTTWSISIDAGEAAEHLRAGHVIICSMRPGDFTKRGHFIVLSAIDADGNVTVRDPNSGKTSAKSWDIERVLQQAKGIWAYSYEG